MSSLLRSRVMWGKVEDISRQVIFFTSGDQEAVKSPVKFFKMDLIAVVVTVVFKFWSLLLVPRTV